MHQSTKVPSLTELAVQGVARLLDHNIQATQCNSHAYAETLAENAQMVAGIAALNNPKLISLLERNLAKQFSTPYHKARVWNRGALAIAWSPDGTQLASGSDDKTVRVWNVQTGTEDKQLEGHTGWVNSVAWSLDGAQLASGSDDEIVRVWNVQTGIEDKQLQGHTQRVHSVSWNPDGMQLASSSNNEIIVWSRVYDVYTHLLYALGRKADAEKVNITLSGAEQPEWFQAYEKLEKFEGCGISDVVRRSITIASES